MIKNQVRDEVLHVMLLGEFRLAWGETVISGINNPTYQSLLAYLILNRDQIHTRRHLAYQFWPDSTEVQARTNLRKAIYHLRQQLPNIAELLRLERHQVQWQPGVPVTVDVVAFSTAVSRANKATTPTERKEQLMQAIACYQDDLLIGHYDDWVLTAREQLRQQYFSCLETLIQQLEEDQTYDIAITYARKLLLADPLHEVAYRRLMRLQGENGRIAAALRIYHMCNTTLQNELGVSPSPATQALYEQLLNTNVSKIISIPARTTLVAREDAWRTLQTAWQQAQHGPQLALISGEAGIGKTRLAEELLHWTARQGFTAISSACYAAQGQLPYAPITAWLRTNAMQKRVNRLNDKWLVEVARLLPELLAERPDLSPPGPLTEGWQRQHFFTALAQVVQLVRRPLLLCIDDLQWCDRDTLDWLQFLPCFNRQTSFLLLGTVRSEEVDSNPSLKYWQQHLHRDHNLFEIRLKRFDQAATCMLAEQIVEHELNTSQAEWLYAETEGNPLFVVEMARAGLQQRESESVGGITSLPDKVRLILETRLAQLSAPARELCGLAATIGRSFTFDLLAAACDQDEETLVAGLDELWQRRIMREHGIDAYDFSHDKLRQAAYAGLGLARRRLLHGRIIKALEMLHAHDLDSVSGKMAAHCEAIGQHNRAIDYYQRAAKLSQKMYANQETVQYLNRAIALLPQGNVNASQQHRLYEQLGDVLGKIGRLDEAEEALETAVNLTTNNLKKSCLHRKLSRLWLLQKEYDRVAEALHMAEIALGDSPDTVEPTWRQEWLYIQLDRLCMYYWMNLEEELDHLVQRIRPWIETHGTPMQKGLYYQRLVMLSLRKDRYVLPQETVTFAQVSLSAIEETGDAQQIALARFTLAFSHLLHGWIGNLDAAETFMRAALAQAEQIGDIVVQCRCLCYLCVIYRKQGCIDEVKKLAPQALAIAEQSQMPEYIASARGCLAWVAWSEGNLAEVQRQGSSAFTAVQQLQLGLPLKWIFLWPLVGASLAQNKTAVAIEHATALLAPDQMRLPDEISAVLQQAITAWENNQPDAAHTHLHQALQLAQKYRYL